MRYDKALKNEVIEKYLSGKDSKELSEEYGILQGTITYWLRAKGVSRHRGPKSKIGREDFFDVIDSEEKSYWLGFLMADGNVSIYNGQYSLKIHISIKDKEIIDKFLEAVESTNKPLVKEGKGDRTQTYYVSLTSRHMVESLMRLGVVPNKTGKECLPDLPSHLVPHFIRGFFDGDGITDVKQFRCGFVSSKEMLESIQEEIGTNFTITEAAGAYYILSSRMEFVRWLYHYMYDGCTLFLNRKRERMWEII